MFKKLKSEAIITFDIVTESPLFIKSEEYNSLNPTASDSTFIKTYINGKLVPVIPGSSIKGAFRSRAERMLKNIGDCDIVGKKSCVDEKENAKSNGHERYKISEKITKEEAKKMKHQVTIIKKCWDLPKNKLMPELKRFVRDFNKC